MAVLSRLLLATNQTIFRNSGLLGKLLLNSNNNACEKQGIIRYASHHHNMDITASRWQWHKTKDWIHFYLILGAIPAFLIITYCNVFIGPATLTVIPEGYVPKQWEYYRHPITRFISRYVGPNIQMEYEKYLHMIDETHENQRLRQLRQKVQALIKSNQDYKYWSYKRGSTKHIMELRRRMDENDPSV